MRAIIFNFDYNSLLVPTYLFFQLGRYFLIDIDEANKTNIQLCDGKMKTHI